MSPGPPRDVRELVGDDLPDDELRRLARVHELLVQAGPPPELPPALATPPPEPRGAVVELATRRRWSVLGIAAAALLAAFFVGYGVGGRDGGGFAGVAQAPPLVGVGAARGARAAIEIGDRDAAGNWPLRLRVRGLPKLPPRAYYALYLSRGEEPVALCGTFRVAGEVTTVELQAAYNRRRFDGWMVAREGPGSGHPGEPVMVTRT